MLFRNNLSPKNMRLDNIERSTNVDDRRRMSGGKKAAGGGLGAIIMAIIAIFIFKKDPQGVIQNMNQKRQAAASVQSDRELTPLEKEWGDEAMIILGMTEKVWGDIYLDAARKISQNRLLNVAPKEKYAEPTLVLFAGETDTACGKGTSGMGPFYCPGDHQVYIDLDFYNQLKDQFKAGGDFARAYVLAHEVGHHVQKLLGFSDFVHSKRGQSDYNQWSVRLELQADYFAGVWTHHAQKKYNFLEKGDLKEGLVAAEAVGDDRIQKAATGRVNPETFNHGTSEQRFRWFKLGLESGDPTEYNPFLLRYDEL